jgi:hypothetical protein
MLIAMMHPGVSEANLFYVIIFFLIRNNINNKPTMKRANPEAIEAK